MCPGTASQPVNDTLQSVTAVPIAPTLLLLPEGGVPAAGAVEGVRTARD